nr:ASPIC/UnbV domain-containing protein [Flammeovirgaceae bacterium]
VSFADLDNDGDQDVHTVMGGAFEGDIYFNSLYKNPYDNENNWLKLKLEGVEANKAGIGSKIKLILEENGVERTIYREVNSGGSFGCNPLRIEIGLGKANIIKKLEIIWAGSGTIQNFNDIDPNNLFLIKEKINQLEKIDLKQINLGMNNTNNHFHHQQ